MSQDRPIVAAVSPAGVDVEADETYHWCRCGRSSNQPFCDGSHRSTDITPLAFTPERSEQVYLCRCKATGNAPFCDGTHARLGDLSVGDPVPATASEDRDAAPSAAPTPEEPTVAAIHALARNGLSGHHGEMVAMGVPRSELPTFDDLQVLTAQLATRPLAEDAEVDTALVIGPRATKPLHLDIPILVSDMSFGALSEEAKVTLARGAELAGTGICSGEGGSLPEERHASSRYLYELGSGMFGWDLDLLDEVQAFHFKAGQGAKTGTGGHLPGSKVTPRIAEVRGLEEGQDAVSPPTFADLRTPADYRRFADQVRERSGGVPIGFKLSAQHIEQDIDAALDATADYLILDGRGGGTGAAPALFRDNIGVPTLPALARARAHLDRRAGREVTLIVTGGLRTAPDFFKAMALGADGIAVANSAIQAIGCVAARMCNTNDCPSGITTQKPELRRRLDTEAGPTRLANFLTASVSLMQVLTRATGRAALAELRATDLTTVDRRTAELTGVAFAGVAG